ncbi:MAG: hypothetical protein KA314_19665 [Chloroflexi bacterium]|nr:hypothetical protein [Chloroflexota bacterium]MBP8058053.1 hypothetical protein [Chloroflexota bacterium]
MNDLLPVEEAIIHTVSYVDIFDYPLTLPEVHRYLIGVPAPYSTVQKILSNGKLIPHHLSRAQEFFTLPGREDVVEIRRQRAAAANELWPAAIHYGRLIGSLPFVKMVAVTGSLAVDNPYGNVDIDYLIVTENDHLWLCRALVILIVKLAARQGVTLCPNYFITERALVFPLHNLYIAREIAQMVPLTGLAVYQQLRQLNGWTTEYLPNATGPGKVVDLTTVRGRVARPMLELLLRTQPGSWLEAWEMNRKIRKFSQDNRNNSETSFTRDWCKGHFDAHSQRILNQYASRRVGE